MGTSNTKQSQLNRNKIKHSTFQNAIVLNQDELQITLSTTLDDYNNWKSNLKKITSFNKQNILHPLTYSFQELGWCSNNTGIVKITYQNYPFILQQELENRINIQRHLSEEQMWYLLYTLVSTAKDFEYLSRKVGDIRPYNIFVNQAGQIKIALCYSWPNFATNYQKSLNQKMITYISPQEMELLKTNKLETIINLVSSQSFSIGLTLLHAGLLFNFNSLYNLQKYEFNSKLLQDKLSTWMNLQFFDQNNNRTAYSSALRQMVKNMCQVSPEKRELSTEVYNILQAHKEEILNIEQFEVQYPLLKESRPRLQPFQNNYIPSQIVDINSYPTNTSNINQTNIVNRGKIQNSNAPLYNHIQLLYPPPPINNPILIRNETPIHNQNHAGILNPNIQWSNSRMFTQIPSNFNVISKNNSINNGVTAQNSNVSPSMAPNYQYQFFDKYANSANSVKNNSNSANDLNIKMTNTINQKIIDNNENRINNNGNSENNNGQIGFNGTQQQYVNVKPFNAYGEELKTTGNAGNTAPIYNPQHIHSLSSQQNQYHQKYHQTNLQTNIQKKVQSRNFIQLPPQSQFSQYGVNKVESWKTSANYDSLQFLRKIDQQLQRSKAMFPS